MFCLQLPIHAGGRLDMKEIATTANKPNTTPRTVHSSLFLFLDLAML